MNSLSVCLLLVFLVQAHGIKKDEDLIQAGQDFLEEYQRMMESVKWRDADVAGDTSSDIKLKQGFFVGSDGVNRTTIRAEIILDYLPETYYKLIYLRPQDYKNWSTFYKDNTLLQKLEGKNRLFFITMKPDGGGVVDIPARDAFVIFKTEYGTVNGYRSYLHVYGDIPYDGPLAKKVTVKNPLAKMLCGIDYFRNEDNKTVLSWSAWIEFDYESLPKAVEELYTRVNIFSTIKELKEEGIRICSQHKTKCGTQLSGDSDTSPENSKNV